MSAEPKVQSLSARQRAVRCAVKEAGELRQGLPCADSSPCAVYHAQQHDGGSHLRRGSPSTYPRSQRAPQAIALATHTSHVGWSATSAKAPQSESRPCVLRKSDFAIPSGPRAARGFMRRKDWILVSGVISSKRKARAGRKASLSLRGKDCLPLRAPKLSKSLMKFGDRGERLYLLKLVTLTDMNGP